MLSALTPNVRRERKEVITQGLCALPPYDHLIVATRWIEQALLGSVATAVAIIAIAVVGLAMLTGRIDLRRGVITVIGCFVLFGSSAIASGLLRLSVSPSEVAPAAPPPPPLPTPAPKPTVYDPYAGAAVPRAR